jgi:hypothetical protein
MTWLWDRIVATAAKRRIVAAGDSACAFANTAMQLAGQRMLPDVLAALVRAMASVRSLVAFERGAVPSLADGRRASAENRGGSARRSRLGGCRASRRGLAGAGGRQPAVDRGAPVHGPQLEPCAPSDPALHLRRLTRAPSPRPKSQRRAVRRPVRGSVARQEAHRAVRGAEPARLSATRHRHPHASVHRRRVHFAREVGRVEPLTVDDELALDSSSRRRR